MSEKHPDTILGCAGEHGAPRAENGPCDKCKISILCAKLTLAKKTLNDILDIILEIRVDLKGEIQAA